MGGVRDAVAGGKVDERLVNVARAAALTQVVTRPPPPGSSRWTDDDVDELVFDALGRVGSGKIVLAANKAAGDGQFIVWLRRVIQTELNLRARETPVGRTIRAIDDALSEDTKRFELKRGHWGLASDPRPPCWGEGNADLIEMAWTIKTRTVHVSVASMKTPPMAYRPDIRAVADAVLRLAGPLPKVQLAEVLSERFNAGFTERLGYVDDDGVGHGERHDQASEDESTQVDGELAARWMLTQLTEDERRVLKVYLEQGGIRGVGQVLECGKHKAEMLVRRLEEKLRNLRELTNADESAVSCLLDTIGQRRELGHSPGKDGIDDD